MLKFETGQTTFKLGGVTVGGQPGEYPAVMIGTMFHPGHRLVTDPRRGAFDRDEAARQLETERLLSEETGMPRMTHVVGETETALFRYVEFVADLTTTPIVIDGSSPEVKMAVCSEFEDTELADRLIYNTISVESDRAEIDAASRVAAVICAPYSDERRQKPERRLARLEEELLPRLTDAGITVIMVDVGVTDLASLGWSVQALQRVKEATGLPAGCAPMNAFHAWRRAARIRPPAADAASGAALSMPVVLGADFVFYGPVGTAPWAYPVGAAVTAIMTYAGRTLGTRPATRQHPIFNMF